MVVAVVLAVVLAVVVAVVVAVAVVVGRCLGRRQLPIPNCQLPCRWPTASRKKKAGEPLFMAARP